MHKLYIDLETTPGPVKPDPASIAAPANYKDPDKIRAYQESSVESEWRKESLCSLKGRVICIGWAVDDDPAQTLLIDNEDVLLSKFLDAVLPIFSDHEGVDWIGFNLRTFDLNWLRHRAYKYQIPALAIQIPFQRYDKRVIDLREVWNGADYQGRGTLSEIADFLGIEGKKDGMDGSKVCGMWQEGRMEEIAAYCRQDVELTRNLARRMGVA